MVISRFSVLSGSAPLPHRRASVTRHASGPRNSAPPVGGSIAKKALSPGTLHPGPDQEVGSEPAPAGNRPGVAAGERLAAGCQGWRVAGSRMPT
jgi:hypothetical protein